MYVPYRWFVDSKFHLAILRRFCDLYESVESSYTGLDEKADAVQRFLVSAEARYIRYLTLLDAFFRQAGQESSGKWHEMMPLPPWLVCMKFGLTVGMSQSFFTPIVSRRSDSTQICIIVQDDNCPIYGAKK